MKEKKVSIQIPTPYFDSLDLTRGHQILRSLIRQYPEIAARAEELAEEILLDVDIEDIANSLADDLNGPAIEAVWDSSGGTRDGYVDPSERAYEMLEEIINPYIDEMKIYILRDMKDQSRDYCAAILLGMHKFETEYSSLVLGEVPDFCYDMSQYVREKWEESVEDEEQVKLLSGFLEENGLSGKSEESDS